MVKHWQDFLDSLATTGGNIVTLFMCSVLSGTLWVWAVKFQLTAMVTPTFGVFTGFTGALLQAQKGNSSRQQMADRLMSVGGVDPISKDLISPPLPQSAPPTSAPWVKK